MITEEERFILMNETIKANYGQYVTLPPLLFQKVMLLVHQAEAHNMGAASVFIPFSG